MLAQKNPLMTVILRRRLPQLLVTVACALAVLTSGGCSPPRPYYADLLFKPSQIGELDRSYMVRKLDYWLHSGKLQRIEIQTPDGDSRTLSPGDSYSTELDWLPLPLLYAADEVLDAKRKGIELDLIAHIGPDEFVPVSARYDVDGKVSLAMGKPMKSLMPKAQQLQTTEQLQQLYGIAAVATGDKQWQPYELYSLEKALGLLSLDERTAISGVRFVRESRATDASKGVALNEVWGQYQGSSSLSESPVINLFDVEDEHDMASFVGEPSNPHPVPTMCLLHEIGHAIADYPRLRVNEECKKESAKLLGLVEEWKSQRSLELLDSTKALALRTRIDAQKQAIAAHNQRHTRAQELEQRSGGPVLAAYLAARGPKRGPTKYGRKDIAESFAESFALFKADPEALRRIYPEAYSWFAAGGHMRAMRAE